MATYSSNSYLTAYGSEMTANAEYIFNYFSARGWSVNAISAMLGNMQRESTINPGIWQDLIYGNLAGGFGIVQWTPATNLILWANQRGLTPGDLDTQCQKIMHEFSNGGQWIPTTDYPESFSQFSTSNKTVEYLTYAFLKNYERAGVEQAAQRVEFANHWFAHFSGATNFTPRLNSDGMGGKFYWYSSNPFYISGYGLPNCTCYAWGRFWEISDPTGQGENVPHLPTGDANTWFANVSGYETGQTPKLGAIICFGGGDPGHVAIVEEIRDGGVIVTSNSAWGGQYFYLQTLTPDANGKYHSQGSTVMYESQGFIYNPFVVPIPPHPPTPPTDWSKLRKFPWPVAWRHWRNFKRF